MSAGLPPAAAALQKPAAQEYNVLAEIKRYRKLDAHNHIFDTVKPREVIAAADRLEIEKIAIPMALRMSKPEAATPGSLPSGKSVCPSGNEGLSGRFLGQCFVNPFYGKEALEEITRCLDSGMIGLGELYTQVRITDPRFVPIIEKRIQMKAPILVHGGDARKDLA